jgi:hypothetical protein
MGEHETEPRRIDLDKTVIRVGGRDWYLLSLLSAAALWFIGLSFLVWAMVTGEPGGLLGAGLFIFLGFMAARDEPGSHTRRWLNQRRQGKG